MNINGKTKIYGIIGNPVSHSFSPLMHNRGFQTLGLDCAYIPLPVEDVAAGLTGLKGLGLYGASVTIPHKQAIIPLLDYVDPVAEKIGAVNTIEVRREESGLKLHGSNTDWIGANRALLDKTELKEKRVVLLGAGGSARAIGFGLQEAGATVVLCSRTESKGRELAKDLGCEWVSLTEVETLEGEILINSTSVGMSGASQAVLISPQGLKKYSVVMDIVYAPLETRLLKDAKQAGCKTVDGLQMLLYQGIAQFELWTGKKAPIDEMRQILLKATGNS